MYAIYTYMGVVLGVNVCIYGKHGVSGYYQRQSYEAMNQSGIQHGTLSCFCSLPAPFRVPEGKLLLLYAVSS